MRSVKLLSEMEEEILYRVPFRSLARFRCVCKRWNIMILEPRLILKNLSRRHSYRGEDRFIFYPDKYIYSVSIEDKQNMDDPPSLMIEDLSLIKVRPERPIKVYKIVHCEGLLLCVMHNKLFVWNPLLKEIRWIKCGSDFHQYDDAYSIGYINHCDYRILRFRCARNSRNRYPRVEVYSFTSNTWKVIDTITFDWFLRTPLLSVSLRGTPYWIGFREEEHTAFVQSFDFAKENFQPIDNLPFKYDELNPIAMEIFKRDALSVLEQCYKTRKICIWVKHWLSQPSWSKFMVVAIPHFPLLYPTPKCYLWSNYFFDKNGRLVITCVELDSRISIYRVIGENEFQMIEADEDQVPGNVICSYSCSFAPSLISLPGCFKLDDTRRIRFRRNKFN